MPIIELEVPQEAVWGSSMADIDRNGLADGLDERLFTLGPRDLLDVVVTFDGPAAQAHARRSLGDSTVDREFTRIQGFSATMTADQVRSLAREPGVFRIEEERTFTVAMDSAARADVGAVRLANEFPQWASGAGSTLCTVDTGVNLNHEQFVDDAGNSKVLGFADLVGGLPQAYDDHGHGTSVASVSVGDGTTISRVGSQFVGMAPNAGLYAAKVMDASGQGETSTVIAGLEWCADQQVTVINMSLGSSGASDGKDAVSQAVDAIARAGTPVVVAAGNTGAEPESIGSPGAAAHAVTVGAAAEWSAAPGSPWASAGPYLAPFSSRGPTADGRIKPDLVAPGVEVVTAYADPQRWCGNDCYVVMSGTSVAAAFVSGAYLLMDKAAHGLTPDEFRSILYTPPVDMFPTAGKDSETGHGWLDAYDAVLRAAGEAPIPTPFPAQAGGSGTVSEDFIPFDVNVTTVDPDLPVAITVLIDGKATRHGWSPDLDVQLLNADGTPIYSPEPDPVTGDLVPDAGTLSTCPGSSGECGLIGRQETVWRHPPHPDEGYLLRVFAHEGERLNKPAPFDIMLANTPTHIAYPHSVPPGDVTADAGPDITLVDEDLDGTEVVHLDGNNSTGRIVSYRWSDADGLIAEGMFAQVALPTNRYQLVLTVTGEDGTTSTDTVQVDIERPKKGGGPPRR